MKISRNLGLSCALAAIVLVLEFPAAAQMGGMGGMGGGMGGMGGGGMGGGGGGGMARPKRRIHKPKAAALSPSLNLVPDAVTSFEGQFLLRQLPQEQTTADFARTDKSLNFLQSEITTAGSQIQSGVKGTGHSTRFLSYSSYYAFPNAARGGR